MADFTQIQSLGLDVQRIVQELGTNAARAYINSLYPNEFEYYLVSFELVDQSGNLIDLLIFPVLPNSIQESRVSLVNVKKTNTSIISLINKTFAPTTISLSGSFGRKIRLLLGKQPVQGSAFSFSTTMGKDKQTQLNGEVKTGYGVTKILERLILESQANDGYMLFFYNLALNNNYLVECTDMSFQQSLENNMMWNYNLTLKSLARAEDVYPRGPEEQKTSIKEMLKFSVINKSISRLDSLITGYKSVLNNAAQQAGVL